MELGHFDKHFLKNTTKRDHERKHFGFFFQDAFKTTFFMENSTQRWKHLGPFFPKSGDLPSPH